MAKRITALKCPQCGSVKKQSVKEDHYICNHCDTEYFLDNDDINVNVHHKHTGVDSFPNRNINKKNIVIIAILFGLVFFSITFTVFFDKKSSANYPSTEEVYTDYPRDQFVYTGADGNPKILFSTERRYNAYSKKEDEHLLLFYDPIKEKIISVQKLDTKWADTSSLRHRKFSDGTSYFIADDVNRLYVLDTERNKMLDVTDKMFQSKADFSSGIATLKFVMQNFGDGFQVMTNDGKELYYFPLADSVYGRDDRRFQADSEKMSTVPADAQEKIHFIFSEKSSEYQEPIQLIKYWIKEKDGFPTRLPFAPSWGTRMNVVNKKAIHTKYLFPGYLERITRFVDLTPGRMFFKPTVIHQELNRLYIKVLPNANPESVALLQRIDTETGEVRWTYKPEGPNAEFSELSVYKDGIGIYVSSIGATRSYKFVLLRDKDGMPIKEIDLDNFKLK